MIKLNEIRVGNWLYGSDHTKKQIPPMAFPKLNDLINCGQVRGIPLTDQMLMVHMPMKPILKSVCFEFEQGSYRLRIIKEGNFWECRMSLGRVEFWPHLKSIELEITL